MTSHKVIGGHLASGKVFFSITFDQIEITTWQMGMNVCLVRTHQLIVKWHTQINVINVLRGQVSDWPFQEIKFIIRYALKRQTRWCPLVFSTTKGEKLYAESLFVKKVIFGLPRLELKPSALAEVWWPTLLDQLKGYPLFFGFALANIVIDMLPIFRENAHFVKCLMFFMSILT